MADSKEEKEAKCCDLFKNLERQYTGRTDIIVDQCKVCGRNHRTMKCEPGNISFKMYPLK